MNFGAFNVLEFNGGPVALLNISAWSPTWTQPSRAIVYAKGDVSAKPVLVKFVVRPVIDPLRGTVVRTGPAPRRSTAERRTPVSVGVPWSPPAYVQSAAPDNSGFALVPFADPAHATISGTGPDPSRGTTATVIPGVTSTAWRYMPSMPATEPDNTGFVLTTSPDPFRSSVAFTGPDPSRSTTARM